MDVARPPKGTCRGPAVRGSTVTEPETVGDSSHGLKLHLDLSADAANLG